MSDPLDILASMLRRARKYTDEQLAMAVAGSRNMREVLIALGLAPRGGNYESVWRRIEAVELDVAQLIETRNWLRSNSSGSAR